MQIALFEDDSINKIVAMSVENTKKRKFILKDDYRSSVTSFLDTWENNRDKESLLENVTTSRRYFNIFNSYNDSHFIPEMIGLNSICENNYHIISLENSLSLILDLVCKADQKKIEGLPRYNEISKSLITLDTNTLDINLEDLIADDRNIRDFISRHYVCDEIECMSNLLSSICGTGFRVLTYLSIAVAKNIGATARSFGRGKVLLGGNSELNDNVIELIGDSITHSHVLNINSYKYGNIPKENFKYGGVR